MESCFFFLRAVTLHSRDCRLHVPCTFVLWHNGFIRVCVVYVCLAFFDVVGAEAPQVTLVSRFCLVNCPLRLSCEGLWCPRT